MDAISFKVDGPPVPQPRPRISTWGGRGRAYTPKDHPIVPYRQAVAIRAAMAAKAGKWERTGRAVTVEIDCWFQRPPSHATKAGGVRSGAPEYPPRADVDNLAKAVLDAVSDSGVVWEDDNQVVRLTVSKVYGPKAGVVVTIRQVPP